MKRRGTLSIETEVLEKSVPTLPEVASSPQTRRVKLATPPNTPQKWQYDHTLILPNGAQRHVWTQ
jgi:hypothetical protein